MGGAEFEAGRRKLAKLSKEGGKEGNLAAVRTFQTMPAILLDRSEEGGRGRVREGTDGVNGR